MAEARHYRAFISYSHSDERWARWLQRSLERYRLPKTFRQSHPDLPTRLYPIFRDRDELASAHDLSDSIRQAMDDSDALIVVCSPAARASHWVNQEILRFRATERGHRIFCFLVSGSPDPNAADCAFPNALLVAEDGQALHEPLAADATPRGDGKRNAMLKIAAGLLGVGVDDLKRRDAQRRARFWSFVALGSTLVAAITIGLAIYAFNAKQESEMRRRQAEGLIGFMLGDLREKLEPIGKLELLDAVGDQAMSYFATLGERGTPKEMLARAVALKQIGDVRFNQGELTPALKAFQQSLIQAEALHRAEPSNNDYLFELGQAEFWVGYVAWQRGELDQANRSMQHYLQYSEKLSKREPGNVDYRLEVSYALSNLGSIANAQSQPDKALEKFQAAAAIGEKLLDDDPTNVDLAMNLADTISWIGTSLLDLGQLQAARTQFRKAADIMRPFHQKGKDKRASDYYARLLGLYGDAEYNAGAVGPGTDALLESETIYNQLHKDDPTNNFRQSTAIRSGISLLSIHPPGMWLIDDQKKAAEIQQQINALLSEEPSDTDLIVLNGKLQRMQLIRILGNDATAALKQAEQSWAEWQNTLKGKKMTPDLKLTEAMLEETLGKIYFSNRDFDNADNAWSSSASKLKAINSRNPSFIAMQRNLARHLDQENEVAMYENMLKSAGYDDPRMDAMYWSAGTRR